MKFVVFLISIFSVSVSFAFNTIYHRAHSGKKIFIDTADQKFISVLYETRSQESKDAPIVEFVNQWSGFECKYKQTLIHFAGFDSATGLYLRDWEIQFDYSPGADLSGCIYLIKFPGMSDATVELNMNF